MTEPLFVMSFTKYESLSDRVVVVTGGASGIGEVFVRAFADNSARVVFLDLQEQAGAALALSLKATARHEPHFIACDLTDIDALRAALAEARRLLGPAAVLVNNAANDQRQIFSDVTPDQFDWMMAVNLRHVYFACQAVLPQMIELGFGSIVNMSSVAWMYGTPDLQAYAAAKAAIAGFTNSLARQCRHASHSRERHRAGPRVDREAAAALVSRRQCASRGRIAAVDTRCHRAGRHRTLGIVSRCG